MIFFAFSIVGKTIQSWSLSFSSYFLDQVAAMGAGFIEMTWTVAEAMNSLFGTSLSGGSFETFNQWL